MKINILVSTMNISEKREYVDLLNRMNISKDSIVINQVTNNNKLMNCNLKNSNRLFSYNEKGLSKSRNKGINKSFADICVLADDDMVYNPKYEEVINEAYSKYKDADLIAFYVSSENPNNIKPKLKEGKINLLKSLKIQSVQLTFKRQSIIENNISFDEKFGAGEEFFMGEENIFIIDCIKKGLKIYSYPVEIAKLINRESTWFKGYNKQYFIVKGACFYRMSKMLWFILCVQFAVRKIKLYKENFCLLSAIKYMIEGKKKYIKTTNS